MNAGLEILAALGYIEGERPAAAEREVLAMIYDPAASNGLVWNIHQVRRVAWLLRDRISVDAWLILNQLDQQFSDAAAVRGIPRKRGAGPAESRHHHASPPSADW